MAAPRFWTLQLFACAVCLLQVEVFSESVTFRPPPLRYDVETSSVWHCDHHFEPRLLHKLLRQQSSDISSKSTAQGIEIIHTHQTWVELISSQASKESLAAIGLHPCYRAAHLRDLFATELEENVDILKHHLAGAGSEGGAVVLQEKEEFGDGTGAGVREVLNRVLRSSEGLTAVTDGTAAGMGRQYAFNQYLNFSAIKSWFEDFSLSHPSLVTLHPSIGTSYYERDIFAVHVTDKASLRPGKPRPKIYLQCLLHPREWISGPVCMYITQQLADNSLFDNLLRRVKVILVPVANPDGYYVTWYNYPTYRLWRKNVQPMQGSKCAGVDLNRNFDSHWDEDSSSQSDDPCDEVYRGPEASSEPEVKAIASYLKSLGPTLIGAIDFHSYSQAILYPPAWSDVTVEGSETIHRVAQSVASTTSKVGVAYTTSRMVDIYSATGTFADWLLDLRNSKDACSSLIPLTIELRPTFEPENSFSLGFILPKSQIYPTCTEMLMAFTEFAELVLDTGKQCYRTRERP